MLLKLALLVPAHRTVPVNDAADYVMGGYRLATAGTVGTDRPPLYPLFLAGIFRVSAAFGLATPTVQELRRARTAGEVSPAVTGLDIARVVQVLLSTLTVYLLYLLGCRLVDARGALVGAALFAFYPSFVAFSHLLWSETLFTLLLVAAALTLVRGVDDRRRGALVLVFVAGLCFGLAALVREIGLALAVVAALWAWVRRPRPWPRAAAVTLALTLGTCAAIGPWTMRNVRRYDRFILVSPRMWETVFWGSTDRTLEEVRQLGVRWLPTLERERRFRTRTIEIIRADPWGWVRRCVGTNLPGLWHPGFDGAIAHVSRWYGYGDLPRAVAAAVIVLVVGSYLIVAALAPVGACLAPDRRGTLLFAGFVAVYAMVHMLVALPRHRLPLMALACLYAGFLLSRRRDEIGRLATRGRLTAAAAVLLLLATIIASTDPTPLENAWQRATLGATTW